MKDVNLRSRRKLLLAMTAGSAAGVSKLPEKWVGPIVDSVTLPAHAATTDSGGEPTGGPFAHRQLIDLLRPVPQEGRIENEGLLDVVLPQAYAGGISIFLQGDLCITSPDGATFSARMATNIDGPNYFSTSGTVGVPTTFPNTGGCNIFDLNIVVNAISETGATYSIFGPRVSNGTISGGSGCPAVIPCGVAM